MKKSIPVTMIQHALRTDIQNLFDYLSYTIKGEEQELADDGSNNALFEMLERDVSDLDRHFSYENMNPSTEVRGSIYQCDLDKAYEQLKGNYISEGDSLSDIIKCSGLWVYSEAFKTSFKSACEYITENLRDQQVETNDSDGDEVLELPKEFNIMEFISQQIKEFDDFEINDFDTH